MAEKIKFCRKCGTPRSSETAKFCKKCGYQFEDAVAGAVTQAANTSVKEAAKSVSGLAAGQVTQAVKNTASQAASVVVSQVAKGAVNFPEIMASAQPGEFALDEFVLGTVDDMTGSEAGSAVKKAAGSLSAIKSPLSTILGGFGSTFVGIFKAFKQPKVLLISVAMAGLWIFLGSNRDSDEGWIKILSWLTFSEGGFDRDTLGTIGGIAGKGAVAVALGSLLSGGIPKFFSGIAALFKKTEGKKSIALVLVGLILGVLIYIGFVGFDNASLVTTMAGISGAVLSLEALGGGNGWIYKMAESLTAKKEDGVRVAQDGKISSLLGGMTAGFAVITAMSSMW